MSKTIQNFYKSTLSLDWSIGTGTFYVTAKPTITDGWLVISPNNATIREIVKYTSTGTDSNGDYIVISVRGVGGTTEQTHTVGEPIRMNITAEYWKDMTDAIDSIVAAGVPNADTLTFGGVQEATAVQIDAGTQAGSTGAELFINPKYLNDAHNIPFIAPGTSGNVVTSNGTDWISTPPISSFPVQDIPLLTGTNVYTRSNMTSNATGTVLYVGYGLGASWIIDRFAKDSSTSNYYKTHTVTLTVFNTDDSYGMAVVGSYLYTINLVGGVQQVTRYLASDLSGVQVMTISGTKTHGAMFSDGTNLFISDSGATDNWTKYTISGTTITNAGTVAFTGTVAGVKGSVSDGTNVWIGDAKTGTLNIRKYPIAGGSATSTTTLIINANAYLNSGTTYMPLGLFIASSQFLGIGFIYNTTSATAVTGTLSHLQAIALP